MTKHALPRRALLAAFLRAEIARWREVARIANVTL
jgi:hypothetical protein